MERRNLLSLESFPNLFFIFYFMKILIALATLTFLASCTTAPSNTPTSVTPTPPPAQEDKMMQEDTMMKEESMEKETMMQEDAMKKDAMSGDQASTDIMMKEDKMMQEDSSMMQKDDVMKKETMMQEESMKKDDSAMMKKTTGYVDYDAAMVDGALAAGQNVILFFHATWCPSCKSLDAAINSSLSSIPADTLIVKVDYDTSTDLKKKYRVVGQHTTVMLNADGSEKSKKLGARSVSEVLN